jgi:hypothetical protein
VIAAIMQPYFFPYIGYFQLMKAVDVFVVYDDAQYMKGGWINRNRILINNGPAWLTLPVSRASHTLRINQRHYLLERENIPAIKQRLHDNYKKAPAYREIFPFISELLDCKNSNVSTFNTNLMRAVARKLGITCKFIMSSEITNLSAFKGETKVIDLCKFIGASTYINPIGGVAIYDNGTFAKSGIDLHFLQSEPTNYLQLGQPHVPQLSIIDVLMFNPIERIETMLNHYKIIRSAIAK